jgi:TRAP-type C4-dicarboxylate transport system permease small subunit
MKTKSPLTLLVIVCAAFAIAQAPPNYTATESPKHVGETATVTDRVDGVHHGIIAGALVMFAAGMIFFLLEQKWPILRGQTGSEKDRFSNILARMMVCVWLIVTALYVFLKAPN